MLSYAPFGCNRARSCTPLSRGCITTFYTTYATDHCSDPVVAGYSCACDRAGQGSAFDSIIHNTRTNVRVFFVSVQNS